MAMLLNIDKNFIQAMLPDTEVTDEIVEEINLMLENDLIFQSVLLDRVTEISSSMYLKKWHDAGIKIQN